MAEEEEGRRLEAEVARVRAATMREYEEQERASREAQAVVQRQEAAAAKVLRERQEQEYQVSTWSHGCLVVTFTFFA